jgi:predicted protein tyrosine phosphatase
VATATNPVQVDRMNVLFVCSRNRWRSPSAERVFGRVPDLHVRSAGTSRAARRTVTAGDLRWADVVMVMERHHKTRLRERFPELRSSTVVVLDIPDDYRFMDPELVARLEATVVPALDRLRGE